MSHVAFGACRRRARGDALAEDVDPLDRVAIAGPLGLSGAARMVHDGDDGGH